MASMAQGQRQTFEERLSRIRHGGANTMGEVHIGPVEEKRGRSKPAPNTVRVKSKKKKKVNVGGSAGVLVMPVALLIGALSMFAGQAAAYHFFGGGIFPVEIPIEAVQPYIQYANFIIAGFLAILFSFAFGFSTLSRKLAVIAGLAAVYFFEGDIVDLYPDVYSAIYSEEYVATAPEPRLPDLIAAAQERIQG